jgi:hypothetical protein
MPDCIIPAASDLVAPASPGCIWSTRGAFAGPVGGICRPC